MENKPTPSRIHAAAIMAIAVSMPMLAGISRAQVNDDYSSLAQREMLRRQSAVADADRLLAEGREAYAKGDFQVASDKYQQAMQKVPNAPMFAERRQSYAAHLGDANLSLAMVYREQGRSDEARALLKAVLEETPEHKLAQAELMKLEDATYTNPALTYEHTQNVEEVNRRLEAAEGQLDLGKYNEAKREYENILRIDAHNITARRGMERVAAIKSDYYRAAYDHTRSELLMQVDQAWELQVPMAAPDTIGGQGKRDSQDSGVAYITEKLRRIIIPQIDFKDVTVEEAVAFLRQRARELDTLELDPAKKGVNFMVRAPSAAAPTIDAGLDAPLGETVAGSNAPNSSRFNLRVGNVPLAMALKYICDNTKLRYKVDDYSVTLIPQTESGEELFGRTYTVPPDFQSKLGGAAASGGDAPEKDPFAADAGTNTPNLIKPRQPIKDLLANSGIKFPDGASAVLSGSSLLVTNTPTELDKIEVLVETHAQSQPRQVKITTKFVEISQENSDELGFDWVIGPFSSGDGNLIGAGGTPGNAGSRTGLDFSGPLIPGVPSGNTEATNLVTSGNRSGNYAIAGNNIDAILNNTNRSAQQSTVAPGIMSMTGLFSEGNIKVMMRGLAQKKGVDLMTAPSITARSAEKATIEIIREFIYPTEYDPPELPSAGGGGGGGIVNGSLVPPARIVTPATPTAFETRNTGVTLEVEPILSDNSPFLELRFVPEIVEFEGFINYGSPITTPGTNALGNEVSILLTENRIEMPVFSTRRVNSNLTMYDGYTLAIGGLLREDVQNVEDKVPILGDIPWIGRLFQTKAEQRIKSNMVIFVTAEIIDPTGRRMYGGDSEDAVTPFESDAPPEM